MGKLKYDNVLIKSVENAPPIEVWFKKEIKIWIEQKYGVSVKNMEFLNYTRITSQA